MQRGAKVQVICKNMSEDMRLAGNRCAAYEPLVDLNEIGRAHPSPDADGVIRVLERICETQKRLYGNGTGLHLAMLDLCIDARAELSLYRAALKSTAAKEGEAQ